MRIKSRSEEEAYRVFRWARGLVGRWWVVALYSVALVAAGVAIQRSRLLRPVIDQLSWRTVVNLYRRVSGQFLTPERLTIDIAHKDFMKLAHLRDVALAQQVLIVSDADVVPATIRLEDRAMPARIRLKGDLVDHLQGDKWSFRVITRKDSTVLGMKQFSLQHPQTRDFLNEKLYHETMRREGLVALRYEFVDLTLNGRDLGLYALEEAFETRLIENNERKTGPVIRFNEDILWGELARQTTVDPQQRGAVAGAGSFSSSDIDAFQTSSWLATPAGREEYLTAINLLDGFRRGKLAVNQVFDAPKLARFFAITDLMRGWHGAANWPNARFYYNPITSRLEPVAFDAFNRQMPAKPGLLALQAMDEEKANRYLGLFFADSAFYRQYLSELDRVSDSSFVRSLMTDLGPGLERSLKLLRREFPDLDFSWEPVVRSANFIQIALHPPRGIQAYHRATEPGRLRLEVANIQALPVRILGLARDTLAWTAPPLVLAGKTERTMPVFEPLVVEVGDRLRWPDTLSAPLRIRYQVVGTARIDETEVFPWPHDGVGEAIALGAPPRQLPNVADFPFLAIDTAGKRIGIRAGSWRLTRNLVIPAGFTVFAGAGTSLDLANGATILSHSPIDFRGTADEPVVIQSSDKTGQGFAVIQAGGRSELQHVRFVGLANPKQLGWELTGAVSFYESPVTVRESEFLSNRSEDALHVMRSAFLLEDVTFRDTSADAFDLDFGRGTLRRCRFINAGNDAVDASGSFVEIDTLAVDGAGDKGLSAGEGSTVDARHVRLTGAMIGLAAKDRSVLRVADVQVIGGQVGVTAYRKKSEYGPGVVELRGLTIRGQEVAYLVERFSSVTVDGRAMPADRTNVADVLYGATYGKASR